jgi:hypothetical protein
MNTSFAGAGFKVNASCAKKSQFSSENWLFVPRLGYSNSIRHFGKPNSRSV